MATEYGAALIPHADGIRLRVGRMDYPEMLPLLRGAAWDWVVDATHPYAAAVTDNLRRAAEQAGVRVLRLVREGQPEGEWMHARDLTEAAALAAELPGRVLLTTGAKELAPFAVPGLVERCAPRVLPSAASLEQCLRLGFPPSHVVCMQGPFSRELNLALIHQYEIKVLVTKASGGAGGFWDKVQAAREAECALIVVDRPVQETGLTLEEIKVHLLEGER